MKFALVLCGAPLLLLAQPESTAWNVLRQGLNDRNSDVRRQAVRAVGSIGPLPDAVKELENSLQDKDPLVRQAAAAELGAARAKQSIPVLKVALDDTSSEVAFAAAKALWDIGDRSARRLLQNVLMGRDKAFTGKAQLMASGEAQGTEDSLRSLAAMLLSEDCDAETIRLLEIATSGDKHSAVKAASAKALGRCGNKDVIPRLEMELSDTKPAVRFLAAASIVRLTGGGRK